MSRLLDRPLKAFAWYALAILVISIPAYVLVIDYIWVGELDEKNWLAFQHTKHKLQSKQFTNDDIEKVSHIWGELQPGVSITKTNGRNLLQDSVYEVVRPNLYDATDGNERFRGFRSYLEIDGQLYLIAVETNIEDSDETFLAVALVTFAFFIVLIVGFILLNGSIARSSWKPFYQTLVALKAFDLSKDSALNLASSDIQEFQELNQSLEQLVKNNVVIYQLQKSFIENASHELQTPIALLKSKLDLLLQEKYVTPEISGILDSIEAPLSRLTRINKNLLVLAKVENNQYHEREALDVKDYVESSISLFEDYLNNKSLKINSQYESTITVEANSFLLETLSHNLLSNAIRHILPNGQILIKTEGRVLYISNSGKSPLDHQHLFERFSSTTKDQVSSGLGLAIVKEIANKHQWQVSYSFSNGFHVFSVAF